MTAVRRFQIEYQLRGFRGLARFLASRLVRRKADLLFERTLKNDEVNAADADALPAIVINRFNIGSPAVQSIERQVLIGDNEQYGPGLSEHDWLFAGVDDQGRVITYAFVLFKTRYKRVLGLEEDIPLISNCFTEPQWRGQRLYPRMLGRVCHDLSDVGHTRIAVSCEPDNVASIRGILRAGFQGISHVRCTMLFSRIIVFRQVETYSSWEARGTI